MGLSWPLQVGSHEVTPVDLDVGGTDKVHLAQRVEPGHEVADDADRGPRLGATGDPQGDSPGALVWKARTLCGRPRGHVVASDGLDLLGKDRRQLCQSCWRTVEGWLSAPAPTAGEDDVVRWAVATVLEIGEALVEGVPVPRLESLRRQIRAELKAAIGGSVRTTAITQSALWVWSAVVNNAKTPERWQEEMRAAVERMLALDEGRPVEPARWRRHWSDIIDAG